MFAGVGIIGSLASILASVLVPQPEPDDAVEAEPQGPTMSEELAGIRSELAALRQTLAERQSLGRPGAFSGAVASSEFFLIGDQHRRQPCPAR